jgi:hypothetical protein
VVRSASDLVFARGDRPPSAVISCSLRTACCFLIEADVDDQ